MKKSAAPSIPPSPDRLIRVKELRQMLGGASSSTIYRWIAKGILPLTALHWGARLGRWGFPEQPWTGGGQS